MEKNSGLLVKKLREVDKNLKNKISYKLFLNWKRKQYKRFLKHENYDFDFDSIFNFLQLKCTCMGLQFAKFGICVDNKKQAHELWQARKFIKDYYNSNEKADEICQAKFKEKYGCEYEFDLISTKNESGTYSIDFVCTSPIENKEEAEEFWKSLKEWELARTIEVNSKKLLFEYISENLESWWD